MQIDIKVEDIDKFVKDKFMECAIGKHVKEAMQKSMDELFSSYRNPVQQFVSEEIKKLVGEYLRQDDVKPRIIAAIAKGLSSDTIENIVSNAAFDLQKKINDKGYD